MEKNSFILNHRDVLTITKINQFWASLCAVYNNIIVAKALMMNVILGERLIIELLLLFFSLCDPMGEPFYIIWQMVTRHKQYFNNKKKS